MHFHVVVETNRDWGLVQKLSRDKAFAERSKYSVLIFLEEILSFGYIYFFLTLEHISKRL